MDQTHRSQAQNRSVMLIKGGFNLAFECGGPTLMIPGGSGPAFAERLKDLVQPELITFYPDVPRSDYLDGFGNKCTRLYRAPPGRLSWSGIAS